MQSIEKDGAVVQMLRSRRQVVLDNIRDNDELGVHYQTVMHLLRLLCVYFFSVIARYITDFMSAGNRS